MKLAQASTLQAPGQPPRRLGETVRNVFLYAVLSVVAFLVLLPLLFAFSLSLQGTTLSPTLLPDFSNLDWSSFSQAFRQEPLLTRWIVNSFVVALAVMLGQLVTSTLAAYALANMNFWGKAFFFFFFLGTLMIPWESTIIPNYLFVTRLGWKDSYQGLIAPFLAGGFGIFLLRQYFLTIPRDLYEAAALDGCGHGRYLWSILVPGRSLCPYLARRWLPSRCTPS
jgi:sn-glycerol 3-phosphate transport system permease protein